MCGECSVRMSDLKLISPLLALFTHCPVRDDGLARQWYVGALSLR
jgi:hypothetical protein